MMKTKPNLKELLGDYFFEKINTQGYDNKKNIDIDARRLLCPERLDIVAKYMYLKTCIATESIQNDFCEKVYKEHLKAFNNGDISEPGNESKNSFDDYKRIFKILYHQIKTNGFDSSLSIVPVGLNNVIIDGGHRVTVSIYLSKKVPIAKFPYTEEPIYDYNFFLERGMVIEDVEWLIYHYANIKQNPNMYVCCLWPIAVKQKRIEQVENLLREHTKIIYKKSFRFSYNGLRNFQILAYSHQDWIGNNNNGYDGIDSKTSQCFANVDTVFYILEGGNFESILALKEQIRELYNIGKHSIHITDNLNESIDLIKVVLNNNSLLAYNKIVLSKQSASVMNILNTNLGEYEIMSPESTLAIFGKLSALSRLKNTVHSSDKVDVIFNPSNYFWFANRRFIAPNIAKIIKKEYANEFSKIMLTRGHSHYFDRDICRMYRYRFKQLIIWFLKRVNLFNVSYWFYTNLKRRKI